VKGPKLHHYVPQFYLKRFVDGDGYLWIWDKQYDRVFRSRPKSIAAESNFYKLPEPNSYGDPLILEKHLSEIEGDVARITGQWLDWLKDRKPLKKIPIYKDSRWLVSMYIALQFFRTADSKDIISRLDQAVKRMGEEHRYSVYATYLSSLDIARPVATADESAQPDATLDPQSEEDRRKIHTDFLYDPNFVVLLADRIDKAIWIFGRNRSKTPFITSDNPVAFKTGNNRMWIKAGMLERGAYAVFPLSPEIILYCHDREPPFNSLSRFDRSVSPVEFDPELAWSDNTGQVFMANRFVISSMNDFDAARDFAQSIGTDRYALPNEKLSGGLA
jgi:hypothetical protein